MRLVLLLLLFLLHAQAAHGEDVRVFAAASLKNAIDEAASIWAGKTGKHATGIYAASPVLAKQIGEGAPADIFVSADLAWMDDLEARGLVRGDTRKNLIGNTLVLIAPAGSSFKIELKPGADLLALLNGGRLATGETNAVPAGKYAKAALESLGLWAALEPHLAMQVNVRAALVLVARGEAPLGIVYGSDAKAEPKVEIVATFPPASHPPIVYPAALVTQSQNPDAAAFLDFLSADQSRAVFEANGFTLLN